MLEQIEQYAKQCNIPIMQKEGIDFLTSFIKKNNIFTVGLGAQNGVRTDITKKRRRR